MWGLVALPVRAGLGVFPGRFSFSWDWYNIVILVFMVVWVVLLCFEDGVFTGNFECGRLCGVL